MDMLLSLLELHFIKSAIATIYVNRKVESFMIFFKDFFTHFQCFLCCWFTTLTKDLRRDLEFSSQLQFVFYAFWH